MNLKQMSPSLGKAILAGAMTALLYACGGGGGGGYGANQPPVAAAGPQLSIGTITGFGSVIINGVRHDDSSAQIEFEDGDDDSSGTDNRGMRIGMNAEVKGTVSDDRSKGMAEHIHIESMVRGPVSSATAAASGNGGTIEAMGAKIVADDNTLFLNMLKVADLKSGDIVNVHGQLNTDGSVQAKFIEKRSSTKTYKTVGTTSASDTANKKFKVGTLNVTYDANTKLRNLPSGVKDGVLVRVTGLSGSYDAAANSLLASKIKKVSPFDDHSMDRGEIRGTVADLSADKTSFMLQGVKVTVDASTTYKNGTAADLLNGAFVEVHGSFANGAVKATSIEFEDHSLEFESELHGTISGLAATTSPVGFSFTVHGLKVQTDGNTVFRLRSSQALKDGMKVEVKSRSIVNDVLLATRVSEED